MITTCFSYFILYLPLFQCCLHMSKSVFYVVLVIGNLHSFPNPIFPYAKQHLLFYILINSTSPISYSICYLFSYFHRGKTSIFPNANFPSTPAFLYLYTFLSLCWLAYPCFSTDSVLSDRIRHT